MIGIKLKKYLYKPYKLQERDSIFLRLSLWTAWFMMEQSKATLSG